MKLRYLLPLVILVACAKPETVLPELKQNYTFEIWQCLDEQDAKLCYAIEVPAPGYMLEIKGPDYRYEIPSNDKGCQLSSASVHPGDLWVTLKAPGIEETKYLVIAE